MNRKKNLITEYRRYYLPLEFPVVLIDGPIWVISDIPSDRLHFHNCMELGICHSESGKLEIQNISYDFKGGDITCIPRNVPHTTYSTKGKLSLWSYIFFSPAILFKGMMNSSSLELSISKSQYKEFKYILNEVQYAALHNIVLSTLTELREKKENYQQVVKSLLFSFYIMFLRIQKDEGIVHDIKGKEDMPLVIKAIDYVEDNYSEKISVDDIASFCCVSTSHFRRVFLSIMNISPLNYLNSIRVTKACNLLLSTNYKIVQISEDVGFYSVANFNRNFKQIMKLTPKEYKNSINNNETVVPEIVELTGWTLPEKPKERY